jgi:hypothetical protein
MYNIDFFSHTPNEKHGKKELRIIFGVFWCRS